MGTRLIDTRQIGITNENVPFEQVGIHYNKLFSSLDRDDENDDEKSMFRLRLRFRDPLIYNLPRKKQEWFGRTGRIKKKLNKNHSLYIFFIL